MTAYDPAPWRAERSVKPRQPAAVTAAEVLCVSTVADECLWRGEIFPLASLPARLAERPPGRPISGLDPERIGPCLIVTDEAVNLAHFLRESFEGDPFWQDQVFPIERERWQPGTEHLAPRVTVAVRSFGWRSRLPDGRRRATGRSRMYRVLDAGTFCLSLGLRVLDGYGDTLLEQLHGFGTALQAWHVANGIPVKLSATGIGAALHYDPRFFPEPRRKVPWRTNRSARPTLGNYYALAADPNVIYPEVLHPDMSGAYHAATMRFDAPSSNDMYAWGAFRHAPAEGADATEWRGRPHHVKGFGTRKRRSDRLLLSEHGLLCVVLEVSEPTASDPLAHPATSRPGLSYRYVYTNELDALRAAGARIVAIVAGWTAFTTDPGLAEQGYWSQQAIAAAMPADARWLKPALLASYGLYGARPRTLKVGWRQARGGRPVEYIGPRAHALRSLEIELGGNDPRTANVIWLGMIQAWVRCETLTYARELRDAGWTVLSVYVDGLYVEARAGAQLPARNLWRVKKTLHNVQFVDEQKWLADEEYRLPGVAGRDRMTMRRDHERSRREEAIRARVFATN